MRLYCTQFDSEFLSRGITMIRSLRRFDPDAEVRVVALDSICAATLRDLFGTTLTVVEPEEFPELRATRSAWAYYATLKPFGIVRALERAEPGSVVAFLDADTWFFSDPSPMFSEFEGSSIGLSPHRFGPWFENGEQYGEFNAGCILWRADAEALRCARDWGRDCVEWCGEQPTKEGKFMNQGYLTQWPRRYAGVHILRHPGVNLAPWNVEGPELAADVSGVSVDRFPLVFYHFSGLLPGDDGAWYSFHGHQRPPLDFLREHIYGPYLEAVEIERRLLVERYGVEGTGTRRSELKAGPGVLRFRAAGRAVSSDVTRREDAELELERHRNAIRTLADAGMIEAALLALRTAGPPLHGSRKRWDEEVERLEGVGQAGILRRFVAALRAFIAVLFYLGTKTRLREDKEHQQ